MLREHLLADDVDLRRAQSVVRHLVDFMYACMPTALAGSAAPTISARMRFTKTVN
jgi:hypothetical protein